MCGQLQFLVVTSFCISITVLVILSEQQLRQRVTRWGADHYLRVPLPGAVPIRKSAALR